MSDLHRLRAALDAPEFLNALPVDLRDRAAALRDEYDRLEAAYRRWIDAAYALIRDGQDRLLDDLLGGS